VHFCIGRQNLLVAIRQFLVHTTHPSPYGTAKRHKVKYFVTGTTNCGTWLSGFYREVDENCAVLCYYAVSSGNFLPMRRFSLSVPFSRVKKMGPIGCPEITTTRCVITKKRSVLKLWHGCSPKNRITLPCLCCPVLAVILKSVDSKCKVSQQMSV